LIARPEPAPTYYIDESIFSNALVAELTAAGIVFDRVGVTVPLGAPDDGDPVRRANRCPDAKDDGNSRQ
jgi:hypothetical protein